MSKKKKGGRYTPPKRERREDWPRPPWFPKHWNYDPQLLPSRKQAREQLAEHEKL